MRLPATFHTAPPALFETPPQSPDHAAVLFAIGMAFGKRVTPSWDDLVEWSRLPKWRCKQVVRDIDGRLETLFSSVITGA